MGGGGGKKKLVGAGEGFPLQRRFLVWYQGNGTRDRAILDFIATYSRRKAENERELTTEGDGKVEE